ncbi:hypothetical protein [Thalassovita sp.]|uniref:hypothetical protein n=1 Tax=Thalassovita sp. TaxID=1979401 RepID=UPI0029DE741B|nr:hypothetical protein [Thalassovita sp.]
MRIILHAGVHATDEDRLVKCLLKNTGLLAPLGTAVPGPSRYRSLIRDILAAMDDAPPAGDARELLLDAILEGDMPDRLLLSNENFFSVPKGAVSKGEFYPGAEVRLQKLRQVFAGDDLELYMGLRNPATFLPAVLAQSPDMSFDDFLAGSDPFALSWSELLGRIAQANPNLPITVWCNEDTPLMWAELLRDTMGLPDGEKISGGFDLITDLMTQAGMQRFRAYLKLHPVMTDDQKSRVISAFLGKFARPDALEEELDVPGWTAETVDRLTAAYEQDLARIADLPNVRVLQP